jgi:hypothetical protein
LDLSTFLQKRIINPKNIRARIALSVNGAVIHAVSPVVDRAAVEKGKIIPRQHFARLEHRVKKWLIMGQAFILNFEGLTPFLSIFSFFCLFLILPVLRILPYLSCHLYLPYLLHLPFQEINIIECIIPFPNIKIKNKADQVNVCF